jgi:hypothetical protein
VLWPGAATDLANAQGLGMAVLSWRLMGAHGLSAAFTVDAGYRAFAVTAFMLLEAQRNKVSRAEQEGLERRRRSA